MMIWVEVLGFMGSGLAVLSYWMKGMLSLRIAAVLSSVFFIAYALLIGSLPVLAMECILLPINAWRLLELTRARPSAAS